MKAKIFNLDLTTPTMQHMGLGLLMWFGFGLVLLSLVACSPAEKRAEKLLQQLVADDQHIDQGAFNALMQLGDAALTPTIMALKNEPDPWKQRYYMVLLEQIGDESITKDIMPYAKSDDGNVREWAVLLLSKFGDKKVIGILVESLTDEAIEDSIKEKSVAKLQSYTDLPYDFRADMPYKHKRRSVKLWTRWWKSEQGV